MTSELARQMFVALFRKYLGFLTQLLGLEGDKNRAKKEVGEPPACPQIETASAETDLPRIGKQSEKAFELIKAAEGQRTH